MSQVDPYIVQIPQAFAKDPEVRRWYEYTNRFLHDLWQCTTSGTGVPTVPNSDLSSSNLHTINYLMGRVYELESKLEDLERQQEVKTDNSKGFNSVTITTDTTLNDFDFAEVSNSATVTLPQYPVKNSVIIIRNGDGSTIGFDGNGKTINGEKAGKLYRKGTALTLQYNIDLDKWVAR